ncbi:MAG TPA: hypothetical protein VD706_03585 [Candidatus Saccharimonadales bacterium]|nr:hypothetical protein [Candidatus Saccharimonadales bacterium]
MAEKLKTSERAAESLPSAEHLLPTPEQAEPLRKNEKDPALALKEARDKVHETAQAEKKQANPVEAMQAAEKAARPSPSLHVNRELRNITLNRELTAIRRHLSAPQRGFSKIIHQPVIRAVSEPLGKTVSRPSGLLGGGLVAFIGTSGYLFIAQRSGMQYRYSVFLALFAGGFILGLLLELLVYAATASRRRHNG